MSTDNEEGSSNMKKILTTLLMLAVTAGSAMAQNDVTVEEERAAVVASALDYMEGALYADADRVSRGIHPQLTKVVINSAGETGRQYLSYRTSTSLVEWVRGAAERMADVGKKVDVTVFDIGHNLATARASSQLWFDFLQLAKIDGQWRIVNVLWAGNPPETEDPSDVAPEPRDHAQIEAVALNYIDGSFSGDAGRMESALHPELTKVLLALHGGTGEQSLQEMGAGDLIEGTRAGWGRVDEADRKIEVEIHDVSHGIAAAKVTSSRYIDHLQLGKVNGEWKIINVLWVVNPDAQNRGD